MKRVLDIGNCGPDHGALVDLIDQHFRDVEVVQAHGWSDAQDHLRHGGFDLVTVNRLMDRDGSSGLAIIEAIKYHDDFAGAPVMLISNYEEYQREAVALGAEPGFGKASLHTGETCQLLRKHLE